jgi:hypothetical protein
MDLVSSWVLAFFGTCALGGLVGWLVGRFSTFELGLGVGMALPAVVSLSYALTFLAEYRDFTQSPHRVPGTVVAVEDRPVNESGSITTPVAVVEYQVDGERRQVRSKGGSGLDVGEAVTVIDDPYRPPAKVARPDELRGGGVAAMLFGTFPASASIFFLFSWANDRFRLDRWQRPPPSRGVALTLMTIASLVMVTGIPQSQDEMVQDFMAVFGIASIGIWMHALIWLVTRRELRGPLNLAVIALNFDAWVVALWILGG